MYEEFLIKLDKRDFTRSFDGIANDLIAFGLEKDQIAKFREELDEVADISIKTAAKNFADEMTDTVRQTIKDFYAHYPHPKRYQRHNFFTGMLPYNMEKNSYKRVNKNPHGTIYTSGVIVTEENMKPIYRSIFGRTEVSPELISDTVYEGYHGNIPALSKALHRDLKRIPRKNPTPINTIRKKYEEMVDAQEEIMEQVINESIRSGNYEYLNVD